MQTPSHLIQILLAGQNLQLCNCVNVKPQYIFSHVRTSYTDVTYLDL